jgi:DNA-binding MurR/RpiR family transcriptional regulator
MTDWTPEEDEAFNEVEKQSNLGKQILKAQGQPYHYAPQRTWVGLTDQEIWIVLQFRGYSPDTVEIAKAIEAKLKEKNT